MYFISPHYIAAFLFLLSASQAQMPIESYQRWLMIIKPNVSAGGKWVGELNQSSIDAATEAFLTTWPNSISNLTSGRLHLETHVLVSPRLLTSIDLQHPGMVRPEDIREDVERHVSPALWAGVAVYAAFGTHSYWGTSWAAEVGWFSASRADDSLPDSLSADSAALAAWTHEMMHTMAWYFGGDRLGPVAPTCGESRGGSDGTHCGGQLGYEVDQDGLPGWGAFHRDYLTGQVRGQRGRTGLGSKAWELGTRREAFLGVRPGSLVPRRLRTRSAWDERTEAGWVPTPWGGEAAVVPAVED